MDETPYEVCNVMTVDSPRTSVACKRARESHLFGVRITFIAIFFKDLAFGVCIDVYVYKLFSSILCFVWSVLQCMNK